MKLKMMTFNVRCCNDADGHSIAERAPRCMAIIKDYDPDLLEEANAFDTLYKQANRIKCGTIGIRAMEELIRNYEQ